MLPRKSVLWVLQNGAVVWNGIIANWQHTTVLDGTLPLSCSTMESFLAKRVINTTLTYTNADIFDIARGLVGYALGKSPNGGMANLTFSGATSGIPTRLPSTAASGRPWRTPSTPWSPRTRSSTASGPTRTRPATS